MRYGQVTLRLADANEARERVGWVGFSQAPLWRPLLGHVGVLEFFTATFHGDREIVELTINGKYQGK